MLVVTPITAPVHATTTSATVADLGTSMVGWYMAVDPAHRHVFVEQPEVNRVRVYTFRGTLVHTFRLTRPGQMVLSPSGRLLYVVTGYPESGPKDPSVTAVATRTLRIRWRMHGHGRCLSGVALAAGRVWSTSGCAGVNRLISFNPRHRRRGWSRSGIGRLDGPVTLTRPRDRGRLLAGESLGCSGCSLTVWRARGRRAHALSTLRRVNGDGQLQFTADGHHLALAGTTRDRVNGADVVRPRHLHGSITTYQNPDYPTAAVISPSGQHLVEGTPHGLALYARGQTRAAVRGWRSGYVHTGDLVVTPNGRWMFDVVWTINSWDGCSCDPPHYLLQARRLHVRNW